MKESDRPVGDIAVVHESGAAVRVEREIGGELNTAWPMQALESLEARVEGGLASPGEPDDGNAASIDPWMLGEQFERTISVDDHRQTPKLGLVGPRTYDASAAEGIEHERGHAHAVAPYRAECD